MTHMLIKLSITYNGKHGPISSCPQKELTRNGFSSAFNLKTSCDSEFKKMNLVF